mgnify:CR=1 FL=1
MVVEAMGLYKYPDKGNMTKKEIDLTIKTLIEAKKLAFEDRAKFYADPEFSRVPLAGLLSKDYAARRRALIRMDRAAKTYDAGNPAALKVSVSKLES